MILIRIFAVPFALAAVFLGLIAEKLWILADWIANKGNT